MPPPPEDIHHSNKKKNLTFDQKRAIVQMLFQESQHGVLAKGVISKVANHFSISIRSVSRIWHDTKAYIANANVHDLSSKLVERENQPYIEESKKEVFDRIQTPCSHIYRTISMIDEGTLKSKPFFINMYDRIHIDEKWFYISKTSHKYYLHPDEMKPYRTCKSIRFIAKIMFLAAVARPRFDDISNKEFNGKFGIWPFVFKEPAKRSSKNRLAGTLETKPILSVTKDVIHSCLIEKFCGKIWVTHLCCQPLNSPDLNVLDLGFFRAIDSLQHQEAPSTMDEFVLAVENAFYMFPEEDLNNVSLTLQSCMVEILRNFGGNNYKIPHMSKKKLIRNGQLSICIECDSQILNDAMEATREIQGTQETQE
ncbi:uncharacterized protein LOC120009425 [Tripterygium wilfordii]|uniref:uncharacterized protein LOC120009425 n=1 Tax=Tripterygium wilfordii TaxID=458696 RepID=UPI0018F807A3|nr:uncharacterized protein LOC120009425 [Tripterygium wilfordii]